ncbi:MAG: pseudouridine synthase [Spirochaetaceae bacterium]
MPDQIRLQVYLAKCGIASRRKCEEIIAQGRVTVNGKTILTAGTKVDEDDIVTYDGRKIRQAKQKIYIALHKPSKFLCSTTDPDERPLAIDLIAPSIQQRLFYVGRLDYLTSGIIFFTNDGEFSKKMTHPSTHIEKEYVVTTKDEIPVELMEEFKKGIYVLGERFKMKDYEFKGPRTVHIILEEGKNRELRKVFLSRNVSVKKVHRIRIGNVDLKGIHSGHFRKLTDKEVRLLTKAADLKGEGETLLKKKSISHVKTVEKQLRSIEKENISEKLDIPTDSSNNFKDKKTSSKRSFGNSKKPSSGKRSYSEDDKTTFGRRSSSDSSRPSSYKRSYSDSSKPSSGKRSYSDSSKPSSGKRSYSDSNNPYAGKRSYSDSSKPSSGKRSYNDSDRSSSGKRSYSDFGKPSSGKRNYSDTGRPTSGKRNYNDSDRSSSGKRNYSDTGKPTSGKRNYSDSDRSSSGKRNYSDSDRSSSGKRNFSRSNDSNRSNNSRHSGNKNSFSRDNKR